MSFPETRHTLIHRISQNATEADWRQFLSDYWRPLCRFSARWGRLNLDDAEDVAAATLEAVIRNDLLARWVTNRQAKLRTLLCSVIRNVLAKHARSHTTRARLNREHAAQLRELACVTIDGAIDVSEDVDAFYAAWAEELLQSAVESLLNVYHREGRGDYFRVLYGRVCEAMTMREIAESLSIKVTSAENYYKHARKRLSARLDELVRNHVARYTEHDLMAAEFRMEWDRFGAFLEGRGGLEEAVRQSYADFDSEELNRREDASMTMILTNVREFLKPDGDGASG